MPVKKYKLKKTLAVMGRFDKLNKNLRTFKKRPKNPYEKNSFALFSSPSALIG